MVFPLRPLSDSVYSCYEFDVASCCCLSSPPWWCLSALSELLRMKNSLYIVGDGEGRSDMRFFCCCWEKLCFCCFFFFIIFINSISQEWLLLLSAALLVAHQFFFCLLLLHTRVRWASGCDEKSSLAAGTFFRSFVREMATDIIIIKSYELFLTPQLLSSCRSLLIIMLVHSFVEKFPPSSLLLLFFGGRNWSGRAREMWNEAMYVTATAICVRSHFTFLCCSPFAHRVYTRDDGVEDLMWMMMPPLFALFNVEFLTKNSNNVALASSHTFLSHLWRAFVLTWFEHLMKNCVVEHSEKKVVSCVHDREKREKSERRVKNHQLNPPNKHVEWCDDDEGCSLRFLHSTHPESLWGFSFFFIFRSLLLAHGGMMMGNF